MMKSRFFVFITLLLLFARVLQAQANLKDYPPPKPPYVPPVPANADWVVSNPAVKPDPARPPAPHSGPGEIREVHTVKTRETVYLHVTYTSGKEVEYWLTPDAGMTSSGPNTDVLVLPLNDLKNTFFYLNQDASQDAFPLSFGGFAGMGWLAAKSYDQVVPYGTGKRPCYHYLQPGKLEAWVDVETGLPVAYQDLKSGTTWLYTFASPPVAQLTIPPRYRVELDKFEKIVQRRHLLEKAP